MYKKINLAGGRFKSVDYGKIPHMVFECLDGKLITCCDTDYILTPSPTPRPTSTPTPTPTFIPTNTPQPTPTGTPTNTPLPTNTPTGTPTNTPFPTNTPSPTLNCYAGQEWYPSTDSYCAGQDFTQEIYNTCTEEYEYRSAIGTAESNWSDWYPSTDDYCQGVQFYQYRDDYTCSNYESRSAIGTGSTIPNWSEWSPDPLTVCENQEFTQYRHDIGCDATETRTALGLSTPVWTEWSGPQNPANVCYDAFVTQTRYDLNDVCQPETRQVSGTAQPIWGDWTPDPSTISINQQFTQYRYDSSVCGKQESRTAIGTRLPCTSTNLSPTLGDVIIPITYQEYLNICSKIDSGGLNITLNRSGYQYAQYGASPQDGWLMWTESQNGTVKAGGFGSFNTNRCVIYASSSVIGTVTKTNHVGQNLIEQSVINSSININFQNVSNQYYMGISLGFGTEQSSDPDTVVRNRIYATGTATVFGYNIPVRSSWCPGFSNECSPFAPPVYTSTIIDTLIVS